LLRPLLFAARKSLGFGIQAAAFSFTTGLRVAL
jgi:hypothetical protein